MPSNKDPSQIVQPGFGAAQSGSEFSGGPTTSLYGGGPNWADGTTNPSTSVDGQITKILVDLSSLTAGSAKIGSAALVGANSTIVAGTLFSQLGFLKLASHIEYAGGGTWADGSTNPATLVESQLDKIITDLGGANGSLKIGTSALVGAYTTIVAGTVRSQITALRSVANLESASIIGVTTTIPAAALPTQLLALKQSAHIEYDGGGAWLDGTTNPASTIETRLDRIYNDLTLQTSGTSGAEKLGCASFVGAFTTIPLGTIYSAIAALRQASNLEYAGGGTWADGTTNPAASVAAQLSSIVSTLASVAGGVTPSGAGKIGFPVTGNFTSGNVANAFLQLTSVTLNDDGAKRIGGQVAGGFITATVRGQLDELRQGGTFGGNVGVTGTLTLGTSSNYEVAFSGAQTYVRLQTLRIANINQPQTTAIEATAKVLSQSDNGTAPCVETRTNNADGDLLWLELDVPDGATIISAVIQTKGLGAALNPTQNPAYRLVRWSSTGGETYLSVSTADQHTFGGGGDYLALISGTTVTATSNQLVDRTTYNYGLWVDPPHDNAQANGLRIYSVTLTYTLAAIRPS